jgi:PAS domain-containing protein
VLGEVDYQALIVFAIAALGATAGIIGLRFLLHRLENDYRAPARQKSLKEERDQLHARNLQFDAALNHMSEGLCIFDGEQRLIVSNNRYAEIYGLRPDAIRAGMTLREITDLRYEAGSLPAMSREDFDSWRNSIFVANSPSDTIVKHTNGRVYAIHHRPMVNGGWIATHDDIRTRRASRSA